MMKFKALLVAGTAMATLFAGANQAEASYAFASNQLSDVRFTLFNPGNFALSPIPGARGSISVNGSANFSLGSTAFPGSTHTASTSLPFQSSNPATSTPKVLGIPQSVSGPSVPFFPPPSPFPAPIDFTPYTPQSPAMLGARSDAVIGAGTADAGGTRTANVAEARGGDGTAQSGNSSSILFTLSSTQTVALTFKNLVQLIVDTIIPGDSATATITNTFSIAQCTSTTGNCITVGQPVFNAGASFPSFANINQTFTSVDGGSGGMLPTTYDYTGANAIFTTLAAGRYVASLSSQSRVDIITAVPTPASFALFGFGLAGLVLARRARPQRA